MPVLLLELGYKLDASSIFETISRISSLTAITNKSFRKHLAFALSLKAIGLVLFLLL